MVVNIRGVAVIPVSLVRYRGLANQIREHICVMLEFLFLQYGKYLVLMFSQIRDRKEKIATATPLVNIIIDY